MTLIDFSLHFVNSLVPGRFDEAKLMLAKNCEYQYQGKILRGSEIINAFEESHEKATATLDKIEYQEGQVFSQTSDEVVMKVFDKISLNGKTYTYSDRLAIKAICQDQAWQVTSIEHRPFKEERAKLNEFLASAGPKKVHSNIK